MNALSQAARTLVRRRAYSGLTFVLIALATAAMSATFAVVRATLWRDLPYRDPATLVNIYTTEPVNRDSTQQVASSAVMLARWREHTGMLSAVEGYSPVSISINSDGNPEALTAAAVSAGLFELLGTPPAVGRSFRRDEEGPASGVIVLSDAVARQRFGSPLDALSKTLSIDGEPRLVVGVMPPGFSLLFQGGDAWIPLDLTTEQQARVGVRNIAVYGRLRPGASLDQARADLGTIERELATTFPNAYSATRVALRPLRQALFGNRRPTMFILTLAVGLVLLIAIVNVANLTLGDVLSRRMMTMTRVALGAGPASITRARLGEVAILACLAFAVAIPLTAIVLRILASTSPDALLPLGGHWIDGVGVLATMLTAIAVGLAGAMPAIIVEARTQATGIAGTIGKTGSTRGDRRLQLLLSTAQAAVTVVLLGMGVLLGRDLMRLMATRTGLSADGVVVVRMNVISRERTTVPQRAQYADELVRSVSTVPGVLEVSAIQSRFVLNESMQSMIDVDGFVPTSGQRLFAHVRHVMPNAFRVLGVNVVAGRGIDSTDRADSRPVAVVSASFAKTYWPGESAIGKRVRRGSPGALWLEVVGVVEDIMDAGVGISLGPTFYVSYLQQNTPTARVTVVARVRGSTATLIDGIRRAVWAVNPSQAINDITPLRTLMTQTVAQPRFTALVVGSFGASAAALVLAGVYATTLFGVVSRRRELGIRAALGASPAMLALLASRRSLLPVLIGGVAGTLLTFPAARLTRDIIRSQIGAADLLISLGAVAALIVVAGGTALIPARQAARVPPTEAIRGD